MGKSLGRIDTQNVSSARAVGVLRAALADIANELRFRSISTNAAGQIVPPYTAVSLKTMVVEAEQAIQQADQYEYERLVANGEIPTRGAQAKPSTAAEDQSAGRGA